MNPVPQSLSILSADVIGLFAVLAAAIALLWVIPATLRRGSDRDSATAVTFGTTVIALVIALIANGAFLAGMLQGADQLGRQSTTLTVGQWQTPPPAADAQNPATATTLDVRADGLLRLNGATTLESSTIEDPTVSSDDPDRTIWRSDTQQWEFVLNNWSSLSLTVTDIASGDRLAQHTFERSGPTPFNITSGEFWTFNGIMLRVVLALLLFDLFLAWRTRPAGILLLLGMWGCLLWAGVDAANTYAWWVPTSDLSTTLHIGLAAAAVILTTVSALPFVSRMTALARLLAIPGVGAAVALTFALGYVINPNTPFSGDGGRMFSEFMVHDEPSYHQLFWLLLRVVFVIELFALCVMVRSRIASIAAFVPAAALLLWIGLDTVNLAGPESLQIDDEAVFRLAQEAGGEEAIEPNYEEARNRLREAVDTWQTSLPQSEQDATATAFATWREQLNSRELVNVRTGETASRPVSLYDYLTTGDRRFRTYEGVVAADGWLEERVRLNSWGEMSDASHRIVLGTDNSDGVVVSETYVQPNALVLLIIGGGLFTIGMLVFFGSSNVTAFTTVAFVVASLSFVVAMFAGAIALNPDGIHHMMGIDNEVWQQRASAVTEWRAWPIPTPDDRWLWVLYAGLPLLLVALAYAYERKSASAGTRGVLVVIRVAVIALLLTALFEPTWVIRKQTTVHSHVIVLLDTSKSMNRVDIYANEWDEGGRNRQRIRTADARNGFGRQIIDRLTLDSLISLTDQPVADKVFSGLQITGDAGLEPIVNDLIEYERQSGRRDDQTSRVRARLQERYVALAKDFLTHWPPSDDSVAVSLRRDLENNDIEGFDQFIAHATPGDSSSVHPVPAYYLNLLRLLRDGTTLPADAISSGGTPAGGFDLIGALDSPEFNNARTQSTADGDAIGLADEENPIPEFGPMDNFIMELQIRRCLRLYKTAERLSPSGRLDLARYRALATAASRLDELIVAREGASTASVPDAAERLARARELATLVQAELNRMMPVDRTNRDWFTSVLDNLLATADGMRRIDVALELLHPAAELDSMMFAENFRLLEQLRYSRRDWQRVANNRRLPGEDEASWRTRIEDKLDGYNTLHIRTFGDQLARRELPENSEQLGRSLDMIEASGVRTAIGSSAKEAIADLLSRHIKADMIGGVVIISDGQHNHPPSSVADTPEMSDLQVDAIGVGSTASLKKLELFHLDGPDRVNKGNLLNLNVRIRADLDYCLDENSGLPGGKRVDVKLYRVIRNPDMPGGEEEIPLPYSNLHDQTFPPGKNDHGNMVSVSPDPRDPRYKGRNRYVQLYPTNTQDLLMEIDPVKEDLDNGLVGHFVEYDVPVRLRVRISPHEGGDKYVDEDTADDNWRDIWVTFTNRKTGVLLIDSRVRYEWRNLERMLSRDPTLRFQGFNFGFDRGVRQPATAPYITADQNEPPVEPLKSLPPADTQEQRDAFFETYDVVIVGDVARAQMGDAFCSMLEEFVDKHKGGVVFVAGEGANPSTYLNSPLEDLVPVKLDTSMPFQDSWSKYEKHYDFTGEGLSHEIFRLHPDRERNRRAWRSVHGYYWFSPYVEVKAGATVLVRHPRRIPDTNVTMPEDFPIFVFQEYSRGAVLFIATDDLWYMRGEQDPHNPNRYYQPLWNQIIAFMASRRYDTSEETVELYTHDRNNPVYEYAERIGIEARIHGQNKPTELRNRGALIGPRDDGSYVLRIGMKNTSLPDEPEQLLELVDPDGGGGASDWLFSGAVYPPHTGNHEIWVKEFPKHAHQFVVKPQEAELAPLGLNLPLLAGIAHPRPDTRADRLYCMLPPHARSIEVLPILQTAPDSGNGTEDLADMPLLFLLVTILLATEWIVRKRARLL